VDIARQSANAHAGLSRALNDIRKVAMTFESPDTLARFDQFSAAFSDSAENLNSLVSDASDKAVALRDALATQGRDIDRAAENSEHESATPVDEAATIAVLRANTASFATIAATLDGTIRDLLKTPPPFENAKTKRAFDHWTEKVDAYVASLPQTKKELETWDPSKPVPAYRA